LRSRIGHGLAVDIVAPIKEYRKKKKTYNTRDSPVVTHLTTSPALTCLTMGERTGSRAFRWLWSYVLEIRSILLHIGDSVLCLRFRRATHADAQTQFW
jgi:hypothetical protein